MARTRSPRSRSHTRDPERPARIVVRPAHKPAARGVSVRVRLTRDEAAEVRRRAAAHGEPASVYMRRRALTGPAEERGDDDAFLASLGASLDDADVEGWIRDSGNEP